MNDPKIAPEDHEAHGVMIHRGKVEQRQYEADQRVVRLEEEIERLRAIGEEASARALKAERHAREFGALLRTAARLVDEANRRWEWGAAKSEWYESLGKFRNALCADVAGCKDSESPTMETTKTRERGVLATLRAHLAGDPVAIMSRRVVEAIIGEIEQLRADRTEGLDLLRAIERYPNIRQYMGRQLHDALRARITTIVAALDGGEDE